MSDKSIKDLAKKRANRGKVSLEIGEASVVPDSDIESKIDYVAELSPDQVRAYESQRSKDELAKARIPEDDLDDHESKSKSFQKQRKKFTMLKGLLGQMDSMDKDGDGIPDKDE